MNKALETVSQKYVIKEGVEGMFHYHLGQPHRWVSLCGRRVMSTGIPLQAWGSKSHLNEKWCSECYRMSQL